MGKRVENDWFWKNIIGRRRSREIWIQKFDCFTNRRRSHRWENEEKTIRKRLASIGDNWAVAVWYLIVAVWFNRFLIVFTTVHTSTSSPVVIIGRLHRFLIGSNRKPNAPSRKRLRGVRRSPDRFLIVGDRKTLGKRSNDQNPITYRVENDCPIVEDEN